MSGSARAPPIGGSIDRGTSSPGGINPELPAREVPFDPNDKKQKESFIMSTSIRFAVAAVVVLSVATVSLAGSPAGALAFSPGGGERGSSAISQGAAEAGGRGERRSRDDHDAQMRSCCPSRRQKLTKPAGGPHAEGQNGCGERARPLLSAPCFACGRHCCFSRPSGSAATDRHRAVELTEGLEGARLERVERLGKPLLPDAQIDWGLTPQTVVGAWAWPDGRVRVSRALVDLLDDSELQAALAHELGHLLDRGDLPSLPAALLGDNRVEDPELRADQIGCRLLAVRGRCPRRHAPHAQESCDALSQRRLRQANRRGSRACPAAVRPLRRRATHTRNVRGEIGWPRTACRHAPPHVSISVVLNPADEYTRDWTRTRASGYLGVVGEARLAAMIEDLTRRLTAAAPAPRGVPYLGLERPSGSGIQLLEALSAHGIFRKYELVLDLGGGLGSTARWLAGRLGCTAVATTDDAAVAAGGRALTRRAALTGQVHHVCAAPGALPFGDARFTHVWVVETLPLMHDVPAALAEARRVVRPGGYLAMQDTRRVRCRLRARRRGLALRHRR